MSSPLLQAKTSGAKQAAWTPVTKIELGDTIWTPGLVFRVSNIVREGEEILLFGGPNTVRRYGKDDDVQVVNHLVKSAAEEATHKEAAQRGIYFHGSSINNLRPLLAQGLIPDAPEKNFDEGPKDWSHSIETYGGIYVTQNLMTAISSPRDRHSEGREVIVCMDLQPNTFFVDEDAISGRLSHPLGRLSDHGWTVLCMYIAASQGSPAYQESLDRSKQEFIDTSLSAFEGMAADIDHGIHPKLRERLTSQLEDIWLPSLTRLAARQVYAGGMQDSYEADRAWYQVMGRGHEDQKPEVEQFVPSREQAESAFREKVEAMTRTLGMLARPDAQGKQHFCTHARIMEPIGYSGSNRIIAVLEVRDSRKYRGEKYERPTQIIEHYGTAPAVFLQKWETVVGDKYEVLKPGEEPQAKAAAPDFGYSQYKDREKGLSMLKWETRPYHSPGFSINAYRTTKGRQGEYKDIQGWIDCDFYPEGDTASSTDPVVYASKVEIEKRWRGTGLGQTLYDRAIAHAKEIGARWFRSDTSMTKDATRAWQRLRQRYPVQEIPDHAYDPDAGDFDDSSKPGYEIDLTKVSGTPRAAVMASSSDSSTSTNTAAPVTVHAYHGTTASFETFDTPAMFHVKRSYCEDLVAGQPGARVIEAELTLHNPADLAALHISPSDPNFESIARKLASEGYDGAQYKQQAWVVFNPEQIRVLSDAPGERSSSDFGYSQPPVQKTAALPGMSADALIPKLTGLYGDFVWKRGNPLERLLEILNDGSPVPVEIEDAGMPPEWYQKLISQPYYKDDSRDAYFADKDELQAFGRHAVSELRSNGYSDDKIRDVLRSSGAQDHARRHSRVLKNYLKYYKGQPVYRQFLEQMARALSSAKEPITASSKIAMKINVPESEHEHFWEEPPAGHEEFWALRFPPKAQPGDAIVFHMNKKPVAEAVISRIEKPGATECEQTGRFKSKWKVYWKPESFKKVGAEAPTSPKPGSKTADAPDWVDFGPVTRRRNDWNEDIYTIRAVDKEFKVEAGAIKIRMGPEPDRVYVDDVRVDVPRQGIGLALYKRAIQFAQKKGMTQFCQGIPRTPDADRMWLQLAKYYPVQKDKDGNDFIPLMQPKQAAINYGPLEEAAEDARNKVFGEGPARRGDCYDTSYALEAILKAQGIDASVTFGYYGNISHFWVLVGDTYIDPTHDQFGPQDIRIGKTTDEAYRRDYEPRNGLGWRVAAVGPKKAGISAQEYKKPGAPKSYHWMMYRLDGQDVGSAAYLDDKLDFIRVKRNLQGRGIEEQIIRDLKERGVREFPNMAPTGPAPEEQIIRDLKERGVREAPNMAPTGPAPEEQRSKPGQTSPAPADTSQILVIVHPGSCCGSADFHYGSRRIANAEREGLIIEWNGWQGGVVIIDGELSEELPQYPELNAALNGVLARAKAAGKVAERRDGHDPAQMKVIRQVIKEHGWKPGEVYFVCTGAWAYPDSDGCVGSVYKTVRRLKFRAKISDYALTGEDPLAPPSGGKWGAAKPKRKPKQAAIAPSDRVLYHGTKGDFAQLRPGVGTGDPFLWLAELPTARDLYSTYYMRQGRSRVFEVKLRPDAKLADLTNPENPFRKEFEAYLSQNGKTEELDTWDGFNAVHRHERWLIETMRAQGYAGLIVNDRMRPSGGNTQQHHSVALLGTNAIESQREMPEKSRLAAKTGDDKTAASSWEDSIPRSVMEEYSYGHCTRLAIALSKRFEWPVMVGWEGNQNDKYISHAWVELPDGRGLDICGFEGYKDFEPFSAGVTEMHWIDLEDLVRPTPEEIAKADAVVDKYVIPAYLSQDLGSKQAATTPPDQGDASGASNRASGGWLVWDDGLYADSVERLLAFRRKCHGEEYEFRSAPTSFHQNGTFMIEGRKAAPKELLESPSKGKQASEPRAGQRWKKWHTLPKGTTLYHGTSVEFDPADIETPAWFTTSRSVADHFKTRQKGESEPLVHEFVTTAPIKLPQIDTREEFDRFAEKFGVNIDSAEDIRDTITGPGWYMPHNYPDGDDILLTSSDAIQVVGAKPEPPSSGPSMLEPTLHPGLKRGEPIPVSAIAGGDEFSYEGPHGQIDGVVQSAIDGKIIVKKDDGTYFQFTDANLLEPNADVMVGKGNVVHRLDK